MVSAGTPKTFFSRAGDVYDVETEADQIFKDLQTASIKKGTEVKFTQAIVRGRLLKRALAAGEAARAARAASASTEVLEVGEGVVGKLGVVGGILDFLYRTHSILTDPNSPYRVIRLTTSVKLSYKPPPPVTITVHWSDDSLASSTCSPSSSSSSGSTATTAGSFDPNA